MRFIEGLLRKMGNNITCQLIGTGPYRALQTAKGAFGDINYRLWESNEARRGPLVLCLHGFMGSLVQFEFLAQYLAVNGYRVLAFDFWGHGLSDSAPGPVTVDMLCEQIDSVLTHAVGSPMAEPLALVGYSMGGCVAVHYATRHPEIVVNLALLAPAGMISPKPKRLRFCTARGMRHIAQGVLRGALRVIQIGTDGERMQKHLSTLSRRPMPDWWHWKHISRRNLRTAYNVLCGMSLWESEDAFVTLAWMDTPVLFAWGEDDSIVPLRDYSKLLRTYFADSMLRLYPHVGHDLLTGSAVLRLAGELEEFLSEGSSLLYASTISSVLRSDTISTTCSSPASRKARKAFSRYATFGFCRSRSISPFSRKAERETDTEPTCLDPSSFITPHHLLAAASMTSAAGDAAIKTLVRMSLLDSMAQDGSAEMWGSAGRDSVDVWASVVGKGSVEVLGSVAGRASIELQDLVEIGELLRTEARASQRRASRGLLQGVPEHCLPVQPQKRRSSIQSRGRNERLASSSLTGKEMLSRNQPDMSRESHSQAADVFVSKFEPPTPTSTKKTKNGSKSPAISDATTATSLQNDGSTCSSSITDL